MHPTTGDAGHEVSERVIPHRGADLGVVLQNVGQPARSKQFLPKVGCLQSTRVRRIPSTIVVTSVKGQEPRRLAFQFRTHHRLAIINSEMDNAATKPK